MNLFDKLFKKPQEKKYLNAVKMEQGNKEYLIKKEQAKNLFVSSLDIHNSGHCQCAYPRFQQIISIDCSATGNSFKCHDTDLLITLAKPYFDITTSELKDECKNERWICRKCGSIYEYGWSDFSISVERQKLKLCKLNVQLVGKTATTPIPLFLGLWGHSYPSEKAMVSVDFPEFEKYMTEK